MQLLQSRDGEPSQKHVMFVAFFALRAASSYGFQYHKISLHIQNNLSKNLFTLFELHNLDSLLVFRYNHSIVINNKTVNT